MMNILESVNSQFSGPEFVGGIGSAFLGTDGINRSCGAVIPEVKRGTNRLSTNFVAHQIVILLACAAQFESVANRFGPDDQQNELALNSWRTR